MVESCVFCRLLAGAGRAEWLWRGDHASALLPLPSGWLAPGHTLVISNEHAIGIQDVSSAGMQAAALLVQRVSQQMVTAIGAMGVNVLNASGPASDQSVDHLHFHVVPRWKGDGLQTWPQGRSAHRLQEGWIEALRTRLAGDTA